MAAPRSWFIAAMALALGAGCSSMQETYPSIPPSNATVARVLMQAPNIGTAAAAASQASSSTAVTAKPVADVEKADKPGRKGAAAQKGKPAARPAAPSTVTAASDRPRASAAPVYRYVVELDRGGSRSFDFEADQKLHVGDRVFVTDSGALNVH